MVLNNSDRFFKLEITVFTDMLSKMLNHVNIKTMQSKITK